MKKINNKIEAKGFEVTIVSQGTNDYISLTDIAKYRSTEMPAHVITNWLSSYATIDFLATWEEIHNPDFKLMEFHEFRGERGRLVLSPKQWIRK